MVILIGMDIDRYHILEQLGEGGMATIYKAVDTRLDREVAIKFLRTEKQTSQKALKRFEIEARALAKLDHPNIVNVLDYGEFEGNPYLVMEYVEVGSLKDQLGKPIPWQKAAQTLIPIAKALAVAHENKIHHRDVKPSNILIKKDGRPMVSDFGVAKMISLEETMDLTGTSVGVGTPYYMAPEQGTSLKADHRTDIYSLGVVFFEMVTGRKPYRAETPMAVLVKHITDPLPSPSQFVKDLPEDVERVILKALMKDPDMRFQNMKDFVVALEFIAEEQVIRRLPGQRISRGLRLGLGWTVLIGLIVSLFYGGSLLLNKGVVEVTSLIERYKDFISVVDSASSDIFPTETLVVITPTPSLTPEPEQLWVEEKISSVDGMVQMLIPSGEFLMGSNTGDEDEQPIHSVYLDEFWIDQTEVTHGMFAEYLNSIDSTGSSAWYDSYDFLENRFENTLLFYTESSWKPYDGYNDYPVSPIGWEEANAYCVWAGRRLPTEAEWEYAARGRLEGMEYPWGDEKPTCMYGAWNGAQTVGCQESGYGTVRTSYAVLIRSFQANAYGLFDMVGNVAEWVNDWYSDVYYYESPMINPLGPIEGDTHTIRGGGLSYAYLNGPLRISERDQSVPMRGQMGFRCAQSIEGELAYFQDQNPEAKCRSRIFYFDDFSQPSSGWNQFDDNNVSMDYYENLYRMVNKSSPHTAISTLPCKQYSFEILVEATETTISNSSWGITFYFIDKFNYWSFQINNRGQYFITRVEDGLSTVLLEGDLPPEINISSTNEIRIAVNRFGVGSIWVNQHYLDLIKVDDSYVKAGGSAGLIYSTNSGYGTEVEFDNFRIIPK